MHRFWKSIIHPLLDVLEPGGIVEIGAGEGGMTRPLKEFCSEHGSELHVIDPVVLFDWNAMRTDPAGRVTFHQTRSLDALQLIPRCDAVLIDGDHNWYTVMHELLLIEKLFVPFPAVFLHDTGWPYGRRDAYADPLGIPAEHRQLYARAGLDPRRDAHDDRGGINASSHHALSSGGAKNGVATAVDDFLVQTDVRVTRVDVPGLHGLTVLLRNDVALRPDVARLLAQYRTSEFLEAHIAAMEEDRLLQWNARSREEERVRAAEVRLEEYWRTSARMQAEMLEERERLRDREKETAAREHMLRRELQAMEAEKRSLAEALAAEAERAAHILATRSWRWTHWLRVLGAFWKRTTPRLQEHAAGETLPAPATAIRTPLDAWNIADGEPLLSIVIPVYGQWAYAEQCIASVREHTAHLPHEIIVVDDASPNAPPHTLSNDPGIRMLRNDVNRGFVFSCNRGAEAASGRFLIFLNSDAAVTAGWADALLETVRLEKNVGLVGPKLLYPDGRLQEAGGIVFADGNAWNYGRNGNSEDPAYDVLREVDYCSGACLLIERSLFRDFGGFADAFAPGYYEDTDLAFRVREKGMRVLYQPLARVFHAEGASAGTDLASGMKRFQQEHRTVFERKWRSVLASHPRPGGSVHDAARHRTRGRILVVDAATPRPDEDSGSLRMFRILLLLRDLGYSVTFIPDIAEHDAARTLALRQRGILALSTTENGALERHLKEQSEAIDAVILSRVNVAHQYLRTVRRLAPRARIIFDTVDVHFVREERAARILKDASMLRHAEKLRERELALVRQADCTWAVSTPERMLLERECPGTEIAEVSNIHDVEGGHADFAQRHNLLFLGNFNHQPNVDAVTTFVQDTLPIIRDELPDVRLLIVGSHPPAAVRALQNDHVTVTGFVPDLRPFLERTRATVAPLRFGAGVKGKIHTSLSHAVPVVASSVAAEGMKLTHGTDVLIADTPADAARAVIDLWNDRPLWERLSRGGMENIRTFFSPEAALRGIRASLGLEAFSAEDAVLEKEQTIAESFEIRQAVAHDER